MKNFGMFLIQQGLATSEQVLEALNRQKLLQRPLGVIAAEQKKLTGEQVFETLNHQVKSRKRFGEAVIELGLGHITEQDVHQLLEIQKEERPALGTILVEGGIMDFEVMTDALNKFLGQSR